MKLLIDCLQPLPIRHKLALAWFADRAGTDQAWPRPISTTEGETLLVAKAKGIYKPEWSKYALSVRQNLRSRYEDRDPVVRPDGSWLYSYFQENPNPSSRDDEYTNRALLECVKDSIPVGVMRQVRAKPHSSYRVLGLALVVGWEAGYFFFEGFSDSGQVVATVAQVEMNVLRAQAERAGASAAVFDPTGLLDARERVIAQIVRRRGQPAFRRALLTAYQGRCAISGCEAEEALEAAHIVAFQGAQTNRVDNGLLLRADIHTLFDLGLISVVPEERKVVVADALMYTAYREFAGRPLRLPTSASEQPSDAALRVHFDWAGLRPWRTT